MKEFKGTPGPWEWHKGNDSYWLGQPGAERLEGVVIDDGSAYGEYGKVIDPNGHNANLLAAAPELLEQLQWAVAELKSWIDNNLEGTFTYKEALAVLDKPNAAIARALGEKQ